MCTYSVHAGVSYTCMNLHVYVFIHVHFHAYTYVFTYAHMHVHMCVHLYACVHMCRMRIILMCEQQAVKLSGLSPSLLDFCVSPLVTCCPMPVNSVPFTHSVLGSTHTELRPQALLVCVGPDTGKTPHAPQPSLRGLLCPSACVELGQDASGF